MKENIDWLMIAVYALAVLFFVAVLLHIGLRLRDYILDKWEQWTERKRSESQPKLSYPRLNIPQQNATAAYANEHIPMQSNGVVPAQGVAEKLPTSEPIGEPKVEEAMNPVPEVSAKCYFPLNKGQIILKKYPTNKFQCIYEAEEKQSGRYEFTIISVEKVKAWDISDAVVNVGSVTQEEALTFITQSPGIIEQKTEGGTTYWFIIEKARIEFKK